LYNSRSAEGFTSENEQLLSLIASMCAQKIEMANLKEETRRLNQLERDRRAAEQIQQLFLPSGLPIIDGMEVAALTLPAKEISGDYYGCFQLDDGRWAVAVLDVGGHGIPAALLVANIQAILRASTHITKDAGACVTEVNRILTEFLSERSDVYASIAYVVLDPRDRILSCANAGHNSPLLVRTNGTLEELSVGGSVLGVRKDATYDQARVELYSGDSLLIYTDGITTATDSTGRPYEAQRLKESVLRHSKRNATQFLDGIVADLTDFRKGKSLSDDVTLFSLKTI
jgi:sigma-B regulation protein RsbU (phosphoserine phosphatase)